jgi:hypothetical protein
MFSTSGICDAAKARIMQESSPFGILAWQKIFYVGTLPNGYGRASPLPRLTNTRVPREQITRTPSTCKPAYNVAGVITVRD